VNDFKLKLTLSILGGVVFSFIFILLALALPLEEKKSGVINKAPKGKLEQVSHSLSK
jgi:hypothetical protein